MWSSKWLIATFTIVSCVVSIACGASTARQDEIIVDIDEPTKPQQVASPAASPEPSPIPHEPSQPAISPAIVPPTDSDLPPFPPRRVITYDQRQEGKYNIRADLENFMIVLIPSSQSAGISFLDLLKRSAQQKSKATLSKNHKKYHAPSTSKNIADKPHPQPEDDAKTRQFLQHAAVALAAEKARQNQQPFIEGRTPYHVDISSADDLQKQQQRDQSPLYRMLLPLLQKKADHVAQRRSADAEAGDTHRASKSLSDASDLINNSVVLAIGPMHRDYYGAQQYRGFGSDYVDPYSSYEFVSEAGSDGGAAGGADSIDRLAAGETSKSGAPSSDGWDELKLLGATEQCGPDRRRDSYGICQFVSLE